MSIKDEYSTITEAANFLGVTRQSIHRWIKEGKLDYEAVGRVKLIKNYQLQRLKYGLLDEEVKGSIGYNIFSHIDRKYSGRIKDIKYLYSTSDQKKYFPRGGSIYEITWENGEKSKLTTVGTWTINSSEEDNDLIIEEEKHFYYIQRAK